MNNKGLASWMLLLLAVAVVALISTGKFALQPFALQTGWATLSLSNVDFISNDPTIGGKAWLLTVVQNGQGQYAVGSFTKEQIRDAQTGEQAQYDLTIEMTIDKQQCQYPIQYQGYKIKLMNYETKNCFSGWCSVIPKYWWSDWESDCRMRVGYYTFYKSPMSWDYTCFWTSDDAGYGTIGTPSVTFESTLIANARGELKIGTISSLGQTSAWVGDTIYASWVGSLVSGDNCPSASDYRVSAVYTQGKWKTIDENLYQAYMNYHDNYGLENCLTSGGNVVDCVNEYNTKSLNAVAGKDLISTGGNKAYTTGVATDGKVMIDLSKLIQYPVITMRVKAEWLGIFVPVGKPDIISATSEPFQTGSTGFIVVKIKNIGIGQGSFGVTVSCSAGFSQTGTTQYITLNQNEEGLVNIPITGTCSETITGSCTINAYDRNNPNNRDYQDIPVVCKNILLCSPNEKRCNGKVIEQCNSAGSGWAVVKTCDYKCVFVNNDAICEEFKCSTNADCPTGYICENGICKQIEPCDLQCGLLDFRCAIDEVVCKWNLWIENMKWYIYLIAIIGVLIIGIVIFK